MKFRDFYNTLYKRCDEDNVAGTYRVRVAHISGWTYYDGTVGDIPLTTYKLLSVFSVENTKIDLNTKRLLSMFTNKEVYKMDSVMGFHSDGSATQYCRHEDGTYSIQHKSNWNSEYDWDKENLTFTEFVREVNNHK